MMHKILLAAAAILPMTAALEDALCDMYGVKRISHVIRPNEPLTGLGGPYDMVTAFLAAFNVDGDKQPWSVEYWKYFLKDVKHNVLTKRGTIFMALDSKKLTDESWSYVSSLAEWNNVVSKQLFIGKLGAI